MEHLTLTLPLHPVLIVFVPPFVQWTGEPSPLGSRGELNGPRPSVSLTPVVVQFPD